MQHTTLMWHAHAKRAIFGLMAIAVVAIMMAMLAPGRAYAVTAAEKQAEAEAAYANLMAMQETLDRLSADYGEAVMAQEKAEADCEAADKRISEIKTEIEDLQGRLGERAREMYRNGGVTFLEMVLGSRTFEEFATSLDMASKVNQNDADMIDEERALKAEAEEQAKVYEEQAKVAAEKSKEAEAAAAQAQATVAEMQATYDSLSAEAEQLLEEERKKREAEEAARAAAEMAAAQEKARQEEEARAAEEAAQAAQQDQSGEETEDGQTAEGETTDDGSGEEQADTASAPAYEGGGDTVSRAQACLGAPYVWGGVGPDGYDCSGLVSYALTGAHERLGTTYTFMEWPAVSDPQPGDVCVNWGHTGIYIGNNQMIHAATYGVGVIVGPVQAGMIIVRYPG